MKSISRTIRNARVTSGAVISTRRVPGGFTSGRALDRKSTRLNSSHGYISYAVFCLKKKNISLDPKDEDELQSGAFVLRPGDELVGMAGATDAPYASTDCGIGTDSLDLNAHASLVPT